MGKTLVLNLQIAPKKLVNFPSPNDDATVDPSTVVHVIDLEGEVAHYLGDWDPAQNMPHGNGKCEFVSGDQYTGEWFNGQRQGQGTLVFANNKGMYEENGMQIVCRAGNTSIMMMILGISTPGRGRTGRGAVREVTFKSGTLFQYRLDRSRAIDVTELQDDLRRAYPFIGSYIYR